MSTASATARMQFVVEIARRLHQYGTSAPRLEAAIDSVSARLDLNCHSLSTPTSILFSFTQRGKAANALAEVTQVIRVSPGQDDLRNLSEVNEIADRVIDGVVDIDEGFRLLGQINDRLSGLRRTLEAASYGIAAAAVAAILNTSWADVVAAGTIGTVVGVLAAICELRPRLRLSLEAISALLATVIATLICVYVVPLTLKSVILASLIVLLPGLTLTTAVRELSTQHLVSGVARLAGAVATLIKLAFGTIVANQLCKLLHLAPVVLPLPPIPGWAQWVALVFGCFSFAVLFRSARRDIPLVMAAAALGYLITYYGSRQFSPQFGVFLAGLGMGALSNLYTRISRRPAALVRVPGIILLVPGSVGFLSLSLLAERDVFLGINMTVSLIGILTCLVAGLLFGDLIVPTRRIL
ncbi:MAG: threonine/serine exporter family protein [Rudaea sp.]|nr:threonine/serine exporter family protein [Rudaea sp.]